MEYLGKLEIHTSVKGGHTVALKMNDIQFELATDMHWKTNGEDKHRVATEMNPNSHLYLVKTSFACVLCCLNISH